MNHMITPWLVIGLVILVCFALVLIFLKMNRMLEYAGLSRYAALERSIDRHLTQMEKRSNCLDRYDFLRYNLKEALIVQKEIIITA